MADNDDTKVEDQDSTAVDEQQTQDETADSDESTSSETEAEGKTDDGASASESFEKRFTQFKGETSDEYLKNLEQGYENSSKEALRLKKQLDDLRGEKLSAIANDAVSDKTDESENQAKPKSMTDMWAYQEMKRRHAEQYNAFTSEHPEANEDDNLFNELNEETGKYMNYVFATEERIPEMEEALRFAWWKVAPHDDSSKGERVASAVKNAGAASKSKSTAKDQPKPVYSDGQIEAAKKFDPSLQGKSRTEIEEILVKYK